MAASHRVVPSIPQQTPGTSHPSTSANAVAPSPPSSVDHEKRMKRRKSSEELSSKLVHLKLLQKQFGQINFRVNWSRYNKFLCFSCYPRKRTKWDQSNKSSNFLCILWCCIIWELCYSGQPQLLWLSHRLNKGTICKTIPYSGWKAVRWSNSRLTCSPPFLCYFCAFSFPLASLLLPPDHYFFLSEERKHAQVVKLEQNDSFVNVLNI